MLESIQLVKIPFLHHSHSRFGIIRFLTMVFVEKSLLLLTSTARREILSLRFPMYTVLPSIAVNLHIK